MVLCYDIDGLMNEFGIKYKKEHQKTSIGLSGVAEQGIYNGQKKTKKNLTNGEKNMLHTILVDYLMK